MEAVAARYGVVAAARVAADTAPEDRDGPGRREGGRVMSGHVSPRVLVREGAEDGGHGAVGTPGRRGGERRGPARAGSAQGAGRAADTQQIDVTAGGQKEGLPACATHTADGRLQAPHTSLPIH
ncbi:hypothetical protein GCM10022207_41090 [Streptomyces lannensis]|uniref:Uncharacterized protein n=1 Tax=Streptomyces lannensis TaxID=766498 RepID=A0ABP7KDJ4_9ACTN